MGGDVFQRLPQKELIDGYNLAANKAGYINDQAARFGLTYRQMRNYLSRHGCAVRTVPASFGGQQAKESVPPWEKGYQRTIRSLHDEIRGYREKIKEMQIRDALLEKHFTPEALRSINVRAEKEIAKQRRFRREAELTYEEVFNGSLK